MRIYLDMCCFTPKHHPREHCHMKIAIATIAGLGNVGHRRNGNFHA